MRHAETHQWGGEVAIKDRIGIDIGVTKSIEDGLTWAAEHGLRYVDFRLETDPASFTALRSLKTSPSVTPEISPKIAIADSSHLFVRPPERCRLCCRLFPAPPEKAQLCQGGSSVIGLHHHRLVRRQSHGAIHFPCHIPRLRDLAFCSLAIYRREYWT